LLAGLLRRLFRRIKSTFRNRQLATWFPLRGVKGDVADKNKNLQYSKQETL